MSLSRLLTRTSFPLHHRQKGPKSPKPSKPHKTRHPPCLTLSAVLESSEIRPPPETSSLASLPGYHLRNPNTIRRSFSAPSAASHFALSRPSAARFLSSPTPTAQADRILACHAPPRATAPVSAGLGTHRLRVTSHSPLTRPPSTRTHRNALTHPAASEALAKR
ncbi:hypothetical protein EJ06DRAFT_526100 [Trichodelitschia bisporula]|uniref:Uncharacterized protein n=1 Tax=Trichodelitschia bisporula TaxID=703511 RepID=A0A6G1IC71_9PEZI|nr:hypothetical protein EJ06DRAFT_526100 [Trichodelitschia bisporula]